MNPPVHIRRFFRWGLLGLLLVWGCPDDSATVSPGKATAVAVETAAVETRDLKETLHGIGTFRPLEEIQIRPETSAIVKRIHFREGQRVQENDLLFSLDDAKIRKRLQARRASLEGARVEMQTAERMFRRRLELRREKVIAAETLDENRAEFKAARARVKRLEAEVAEIRERLEDTRITAPVEGLTGEIFVDRGDFVEAGDLLVTVVQIRRLKLSFTVPERFAGRVRRGQPVSARTPAHPERSFRGEVYFIAPRIVETTRDLLLKAYVDNPEEILQPGAFAEVELTVGRREGAAIIPEEALVPTRSGFGVFVVEDAVAHWREVAVGLRRPGIVEIRRGLSEGQQVIRAGHISVSDGDAVNITNPAEP
jgi:membrane fusion protein (multidrug efflux system)